MPRVEAGDQPNLVPQLEHRSQASTTGIFLMREKGRILSLESECWQEDLVKLLCWGRMRMKPSSVVTWMYLRVGEVEQLVMLLILFLTSSSIYSPLKACYFTSSFISASFFSSIYIIIVTQGNLPLGLSESAQLSLSDSVN